MSQRRFRLLVSVFIVIVTFMVAFPVDHLAQIRIRGITDRRRKADKEPDRKEFQLPTNGEFKANPTFFAASSNDERCNAIDLWLSSIRYEASQSRQYKNSRYLWNNGDLDLNRIDFKEILKFSVPAFRNIFGKPLQEFTERDSKEVAKALDKCSYQPWVEAYLENLFKNPSLVQSWTSAFESIEQANANEKLERERQLYRERYREESRRTGYSVGEVIKETDLYRLHAALPGDYENWCSTQDKRAMVSLVFKADENFQIDNNPKYWTRFENEMLPAINARCSGAEKIYIVHYVEGFYLNLGEYEIGRQVDPSHPSDALSLAVYSANSPDESKHDWLYGNGSSNILDSASQTRRRARGGRDYSSDGLTNDSSLTSISRLRAVLKNRQAEAQARREKLAAEEQARRVEEQRQAEIRRREEVARKRESHLAKAADALRFYKRGAPANYNFSGYEWQSGLQNIYTGNFEPFMAGFASEAAYKARVVGSIVGSFINPNRGAALADAFDLAAQTVDVTRRRAFVNMAYYAYHNVYAQQCFSNKEVPWDISSSYTFYKTRGGFTVPGSERKGIVLPMRRPYKDRYDAIYEEYGHNNVSPEIPQTFLNDFNKLLKAEGCASPAVRHFEINLYLAAEWLLPLQELQPSAVEVPQRLQAEKQVPRTRNARTPTRVVRPRPKTMPPSARTSSKPATPSAPPAKEVPATAPTYNQFRVSNQLLTDVQIRRGDKVAIAAGGSITLGVFAGSASPDGIGGFQDYSIVSRFPHGSLLVRVRQAQSDEWTFCGSRCSLTADRDGYLEFIVNDGDSANNSGSYQVLVLIQKSQGTNNPDVISTPTPIYPEKARAARVEGTVTVEVIINEEGHVISARVLSGPKLLHASALEAAYKAIFRPIKLDEKAVKATGVLTYKFSAKKVE